MSEFEKYVSANPWPPLMASVLLVAVTLVMAWLYLPRRKDRSPQVKNTGSDQIQGWCAVAAFLAVASGLGMALYHVQNSPQSDQLLLEGGFMLLAGILAATLVALAGRLVAGEIIGIDSKWGTLGGAGSGHSVTRPVILLVVLAGGLVALVALSYVGHSPKKEVDAATRVQCCCIIVDNPGGKQQ